MLIPLVSISCAAFKQSSHIQSVIELIFATLFSALQLFFFFIGWICRLIWNYWCIDYFPIHCFNWQSVPKLWKMWNCQCRALHSVCNWLILVTRLIQSVWNVWTIQWQSYQSIQSNDVKINSFLLEGIFTRVSSKTKHQVSKLLCSQIHNGIEQIRNYQKLLLLWWWFFSPLWLSIAPQWLWMVVMNRLGVTTGKSIWLHWTKVALRAFTWLMFSRRTQKHSE